MAIDRSAKVYVAGHRGLLGSAVLRRLQQDGFTNVVHRSSKELDLLDRKATWNFLDEERPRYVFLCAAKVGGIKANFQGLGEFLYRNLQIQLNVIEGARRIGVEKLLFVASTCVYPPNAPSPVKEEMMFTGGFEPTNEGYAVAKYTGIKMCELYRKQYKVNYISAVPCNLFGLNDHYDPDQSHVLQSLIRRVHEAKVSGQKSMTVWGSGRPRREFMLSDDCAAALLFLMDHYDSAEPINVGTGRDKSIVELAQTVSQVLQYPVDLEFDTSKPDGIFQKLSDVSRLSALGWTSKTTLEDGIRIAYGDFLNYLEKSRGSS